MTTNIMIVGVGGQGVGAVGAADASHLIGGDGNADAGGADDDALVALTGGHHAAYLLAVHGIVYALGRVAAHILEVDVVLLQPDENVLLQQIAAVIAADGNFHGVFSSYNSLNSGFPPVKVVK